MPRLASATRRRPPEVRRGSARGARGMVGSTARVARCRATPVGRTDCRPGGGAGTGSLRAGEHTRISSTDATCDQAWCRHPTRRSTVCRNLKISGRRNDPPLPRRHSGRRTGRPPPTHRSVAVVRKRDSRRRVAGRDGRDDAGARALLGHRVRLAEVRDEAERAASVHHRDRRSRHHFIHVESPHEKALPLIMMHGWPGSVVEMLNVVGPLTDPTAQGGARGRVRRGGSVDSRLRVLGETEAAAHDPGPQAAEE